MPAVGLCFFYVHLKIPTDSMNDEKSIEIYQTTLMYR